MIKSLAATLLLATACANQAYANDPQTITVSNKQQLWDAVSQDNVIVVVDGVISDLGTLTLGKNVTLMGKDESSGLVASPDTIRMIMPGKNTHIHHLNLTMSDQGNPCAICLNPNIDIESLEVDHVVSNASFNVATGSPTMGWLKLSLHDNKLDIKSSPDAAIALTARKTTYLQVDDLSNNEITVRQSDTVGISNNAVDGSLITYKGEVAGNKVTTTGMLSSGLKNVADTTGSIKFEGTISNNIFTLINASSAAGIYNESGKKANITLQGGIANNQITTQGNGFTFLAHDDGLIEVDGTISKNQISTSRSVDVPFFNQVKSGGIIVLPGENIVQNTFEANGAEAAVINDAKEGLMITYNLGDANTVASTLRANNTLNGNNSRSYEILNYGNVK